MRENIVASGESSTQSGTSPSPRSGGTEPSPEFFRKKTPKHTKSKRPQPARFNVDTLLSAIHHYGASDLHIKTESKPRVRIGGDLHTLDFEELSEETVQDIVSAIRPEWKNQPEFNEKGVKKEEDFAYTDDRGNRYRVNVFHQRGKPSVVFRSVAKHPPSMEGLQLPEVIEELALSQRGFVLVTGPTGSGKTTTLASIVRKINETRSVAITTIEDPIEILHEDSRGVVSQREVGYDTEDFLSGLRSVLRQDPDVIMLGEIRDIETLRTALSAAETGHLVLSTAHTLDAQETINRLIDMFPTHERAQARMSLAGSLKGVICQRLVLKKDSNERVAVFEIMTNTGRIFDSIIDAENGKNISQIISESAYDGMQTFDQHIISLIKKGVISLESGLSVANKPHDIKAKLRKEGISVK